MMINIKVKESLHLRQLVGSFLPNPPKEDIEEGEDEQGIYLIIVSRERVTYSV